METPPLRYDKWVEEALCQVVRKALELAAISGLPGDHHYYITFNTNHDGVVIPRHLHAEYPNDMTIVLQHQFEELTVNDDTFSVSLRFGGRLEYLRVPFASISSFADPSVGFGIQIRSAHGQDEDGTSSSALPTALKEAKNGTGYEKHDVGKVGKKNPEKTGEVVALDSFRKK